MKINLIKKISNLWKLSNIEISKEEIEVLEKKNAKKPIKMAQIIKRKDVIEEVLNEK